MLKKRTQEAFDSLSGDARALMIEIMEEGGYKMEPSNPNSEIGYERYMDEDDPEEMELFEELAEAELIMFDGDDLVYIDVDELGGLPEYEKSS